MVTTATRPVLGARTWRHVAENEETIGSSTHRVATVWGEAAQDLSGLRDYFIPSVYCDQDQVIIVGQSPETELIPNANQYAASWRWAGNNYTFFTLSDTVFVLGYQICPRVDFSVPSSQDLAHEALNKFERNAHSVIADHHTKLLASKIRDWVSEDDSSWKQTLIEFTVEAASDSALALWDALNEELETFLGTSPYVGKPELHQQLSVTVRWR